MSQHYIQGIRPVQVAHGGPLMEELWICELRLFESQV